MHLHIYIIDNLKSWKEAAWVEAEVEGQSPAHWTYLLSWDWPLWCYDGATELQIMLIETTDLI